VCAGPEEAKRPKPQRRKHMSYIDDALKSGELKYDLEVISHDDKKEISDYTQEEVVHEAEYVLSNYFEHGHALNDSLSGEDGPVERRKAQQDVAYLRRFIKKYKL
jgi:hypothetical protein